jgi:hypothetical protein
LTNGKRGAPKGNLNATKKLPWLEKYDLTSPAGITEVLQELIREAWQGNIGTRQASAITSALKLLMEQVEIEPTLKKFEEWERTHKQEVK